MFKLLSKLANQLDQQGLYQEANLIDTLIKNAISSSELIRALKNDDAAAAHKALVGMSGDDLGLTYKEFGELTSSIDAAKRFGPTPGLGSQLDKAREILGITKNTQNVMSLDPQTHNPITGKPWGNLKIQLVDEFKKLKTIIEQHQGKAAKGKYDVGINPPEGHIYIDSGLAFNPEKLVEELEKAGFQKHIPDGEQASRSKTIGKDRIVVSVDISGVGIPTEITIDPMTKENYDAVGIVFGKEYTFPSGGGPKKDLEFDEAVKKFEDYDNQP